MTILEIRNLASENGEVQVLWEASFDLQEKKLIFLVGGNGVGKTTMLRTVMGLIRPWEGTVVFDGKDVSWL